MREKGGIEGGRGVGYENLLGREVSEWIAGSEGLGVGVAFSGDDHDYCDVTHKYEGNATTREITVKSFSMVMNVRRPGYQLLTLSSLPPPTTYPSHEPPPTHPTPNGDGGGTDAEFYATRACSLPDQVEIWIAGYAFLAGATVLGLFLRAVWRGNRKGQGREYASLAGEEDSGEELPYGRGRDEEETEVWDPITPRSSSARSRSRFGQLQEVVVEQTPTTPRIGLEGGGRPVISRRAVRRWVGDVVDVALPALAVWVLIAWWNFQDFS